DTSYKGRVGSVHLPYAADWYGPATGKRPADESLDSELLRYRYYGRNEDEIVEALYTAMKAAEPFEPAYGVLHAGSANIEELLCYDYSDDDIDVIDVLAEMLNRAVSRFPGGEPPFTLALENTWWPGFRAEGPKGYRRLTDKLEFDDWGLCLDTGHLLFTTKGSDDEAGAIEILNRVADTYPEEMVMRIITMHLHVNTSATIHRTLSENDCARLPVEERFKRAYKLIGNVDQHRPFSDPSVLDYVERIDPDFIVHEMGAVNIDEQIRDHICQRSLFS
ncbi:MAG: TIM barrel protein, partial [Candidatus Methanomethylophilaceae archaeon]|nr:TIM barrel protein [Candidatus Methanomethylophilaceae archaeon]